MTMRSAVQAAMSLSLVMMLFTNACKGRKVEAPPENRSNSSKDATAPSNIHLTPEAIQTIGLRTEPARAQELGGHLVTTAVIKPNEYRIAHVSPRISGKAVEVYAKLGDEVQKGTVLAELDSLELGARKAALLRAEADLNVARRNYEREKGLYAKQISSERDYLTAKGDFERSEAAYNEAREALRLLDVPESAIARITWSGPGLRFSLFPLLSPFAGTVLERHITLGEQIQPDETVFTIADLRVVWLLADIYEKELGRVGLGDPVQISVDSYPGEIFHGRIAYISNTIAPATRTTSARVEIENPDLRLRTGMFAAAQIALRPSPGQAATGIVVSADAIQRVDGKPLAFVEQQSGIYSPRKVTLGNVSSKVAEVTSGLAAGERVVTNGSFYLKSALIKQEIGGD